PRVELGQLPPATPHARGRARPDHDLPEGNSTLPAVLVHQLDREPVPHRAAPQDRDSRPTPGSLAPASTRRGGGGGASGRSRTTRNRGPRTSARRSLPVWSAPAPPGRPAAPAPRRRSAPSGGSGG